MSAKMNHEELVELLQEGKIGFLRFVMDSENADDYPGVVPVTRY